MTKIKATVKNVVEKPVWEFFTGSLAFLAAIDLFLQHTEGFSKYYSLLTSFIYVVIIIFAVDYLLRLWVATDKFLFFRTNIIELLAIIPLSSLFQSLRIIRFIRQFIFLQYSIKHWDDFINEGSIFHVLMVVVVLVFGSGAGLYFFEREYNDNIQSFGDALWWALVTVTTVGYGDIVPVTLDGRIMGGFLMITGIGTIYFLTAYLATAIVRRPCSFQPFVDETLQLIAKQLSNLEKLDEQDFANLQAMLRDAWEKKRNND